MTTSRRKLRQMQSLDLHHISAMRKRKNCQTKCSRIGYPKTRQQVLGIVQEIVGKRHPDVCVTNGWWERFSNRHPNITSIPLSYVCAMAEEMRDHWKVTLICWKQHCTRMIFLIILVIYLIVTRRACLSIPSLVRCQKSIKYLWLHEEPSIGFSLLKCHWTYASPSHHFSTKNFEPRDYIQWSNWV